MTTGYGGYPPAADTGVGGVVRKLGDRVWRRAEPRFGISLAGVGVLMIIIGVLVWATDFAVGDEEDAGDPDTTLGIVLSMLVIAAGYVLLVRFKKGPLATAGVAAAVLAVPVLLAYATFDPVEPNEPDITFEDDGSFDEDGTFEDDFSVESDVPEMPFNIDVIAVVSIAVWMASFLLIPAANGRMFFLAASQFFFWLYLLEKVEEGAIIWLLSLPAGGFFFPFFGGFGYEPPDPSTIGGLSLIIGLGYYGAAFGLDRGKRHGMATPFTVAGLVATAIGIAHLGGDLELTGSGILLIIVGTLLALYGVTQGRRFTAWAWAAAVGLGVLLIVGDAFEENAAGFGISAIVLGAGVVVLGWFVTGQFSEPDEMQPGPSTFTPRRPGPGGPAAVIVTNQGYGVPSAPGAAGWPTPAAGQPPVAPPTAPPQPPYTPPVAPQPPPVTPPAEPQGPPTAPPTVLPTTPPTEPTAPADDSPSDEPPTAPPN